MKRFAPALAPIVLLLADPARALADIKGPGEDQPLDLPAPGAPTHQLGTAGGSGGSLARTFLGLAVVVGVIYGLYWVLKQVKKSREERAHGHGLHTEATVPLGPNRALHLVRAGRELVLVGVAEHGVVPIRTYSEEEAIAVGLIDPNAPAGPAEGNGDGGTTARDGLLTAQARAREIIEGLRARTVRG